MDIEDTEFLKRLAQANAAINKWSDTPELVSRMNIILSDAMVISTVMLANIIRTPARMINNQLLKENSPYATINVFPLSAIPDVVRNIDSSRELFWYSDGTQLYPMSKLNIPQYLYFLSRNMSTPEKDKGLNVIQIKKLLPDKWRENL